MPTVLNAANEQAVGAFLDGRLAFTGIPHVIGRTMDAHRVEAVTGIQVVRQVDGWARAHAETVARELEFTV